MRPPSSPRDDAFPVGGDLLQVIVEHLPVRAFWKDRDSRYLGCNTAFARDAGVSSPAEIVGRTDFDLGWSAQAELYRSDDRAVMDSGQPRLGYEEPQTTPEGRTIWLRTSKVPLRDEAGRVIGVLGIYDDVTAQHEAQEALRLTQFASDRARDAICRFDETGAFQYVNQAFCELLGYDRAELARRRIWDVTTLLSAAEFPARWRHLLAIGSLRRETWLHHRDGRRVPVDLSVNHLRYDGRDLVVAFIHDLTRRRQIEARAEESEQRFRDLFDYSPDPCWIVSPDNLFVLCNRAAADALGYAEVDELRGTHPGALSPPQQPDGRASVVAAEAMMAEARARGVHRFEWIHRDRAGRDFPVEVTLARIELGGRPHLYCVWRDISVRKEQERELIEIRRLHEEAQRIAHLGHWQIDHRRGGLRWSDEASRIFGRDPALGTPTFTEFVELLHADDRLSVLSAIERSLREREPFSLDHRVLASDGTVRWVTARWETTFDEAGPVCSTGTMTDVTDRRRAEHEEARLRAQLAATERLESIGRLAGGVAHDFNNMLEVILGSATFAIDELGPDHPVQAELRDIVEAAQRSADLTRQLLAFARRQTVAPIDLDLDEKVGAILKILRRVIGEDVSLVWIPCGDLAPVRIDPSQVDQILTNLCVNARDAISGVGTVRLETANVTAAFPETEGGAVGAPRPWVCLTVTDSGCGMSEDVLANLFEPFFTTKGLGSGTGLGLATVYGIVKQNRGHLQVSSAPGQGTSFRLYLPRSDGGERPRTAPLPVGIDPIGGDETVLLCEDEPVVMRFTRRMLEQLGYKVLAADSPDEALRLAESHAAPLDLVLTDVIMPKMRGTDLALAVLARHPEARVVFMSGYTADVLAPQGVIAPDVAFLQKPFSIRELAVRLRDELDKTG